MTTPPPRDDDRGAGDDEIAEAGRDALDAGRLDEAVALLEQLTAAGTARTDVWWNLGLAHKLRTVWPAAAAAFERYTALLPDAEEGYWNLAVAATALRDWATARRCWASLGLDVGTGDGPPEADFGAAPIRLNPTPEGAGEVVWGRRIDPCRVRLESVPLPDSGHRWHDVLLHDVAPRGERRFGDRMLGVFDELERMEPSPHPTHRAELAWPGPADEQALHDLLAARGLGGEHWTASVRFVCTSCSIATGHVHPTDEPAVIRPTGTWGLAGSTADVRRVLADWEAQAPGRSSSAPELVG